MGLFSKKKEPEQTYDRENTYPVFLSSICTGETLAGFRDRKTKKFNSVMLIAGESDKREFMRRYGLAEGDIKQEW